MKVLALILRSCWFSLALIELELGLSGFLQLGFGSVGFVGLLFLNWCVFFLLVCLFVGKTMGKNRSMLLGMGVFGFGGTGGLSLSESNGRFRPFFLSCVFFFLFFLFFIYIFSTVTFF